MERRIRWKDKNGQAQEQAVEELIFELPNLKPMPVHPWLFTGSRILKEGFEEDLSKSLIAVYRAPGAPRLMGMPPALHAAPNFGGRVEIWEFYSSTSRLLNSDKSDERMDYDRLAHRSSSARTW